MGRLFFLHAATDRPARLGGAIGRGLSLASSPVPGQNAHSMKKLFTPPRILRLVFIAITIALGVTTAAIDLTFSKWTGAAGGAAFGIFVVLIEAALRNLSFRQFSNATAGLLVGLFCGMLINYVLKELFDLVGVTPEAELATTIIPIAIHLALGYWGMSLAIRANRQEFSFLIPYVRFRQESAQDSPLLVDSNVIIDGRIERICETGFLSGALVVPRFVLDELHLLADSPDAMKRNRGKRGLEYLREMQGTPSLEVTIQEDDHNHHEELTDTRLVQLARRLGARLLTNDRNLGRVARLQGVTVLNLNELTQAMKPNLLPGEPMALKLLREGKDRQSADRTCRQAEHAAPDPCRGLGPR